MITSLAVEMGNPGLADIQLDAYDRTVAFTVTEGSYDITNILGDLALYWNMSKREVIEKLKSIPLKKPLTAEWNAKQARTPREVSAFYQQTENYIAELAKFNIELAYWRRIRPLTKVSGTVVDFGGGIGTLSLILHKMGRRVVYIDLHSLHRDFAEFRFKRRNADIEARDRLDRLEVDAIISSDTIEHIHPDELPGVVRNMAKVLREGGLVLTINDFETKDDRPMHYATAEQFAKYMNEEGFEGGPLRWVKGGQSQD